MTIKVNTNEVTNIESHDDEFSSIVLDNGAKIYVSVKDNDISIKGEELDIE